MFAFVRKAGGLAVLLTLVASLGGCQLLSSASSSVFGKDDKVNFKGNRVSVLALQQKLEADPKLAQVEVKLPAPYENAEWPSPGGYANHAMYHLSAAENLTRAWRGDAGASADSYARLLAPPIVADGRVYVLGAVAEVTAFDLASGNKLWHKRLVPKGEKKRDAFGGGISYEAGRVFAATGFGRVYALEAKTGEQIWQRNFNVPFHAAPTADGGRVFAVTHDNELHVLAADDGRVLWTHQGIAEQASLLGNASPAVSGEIAVVPYSSGEIYAFRVQNGQVIWSDALTRSGTLTAMSTINDIAGRPVIDRGRVIAISHAGRLVSVDLRTGERIWTRDISGIQTPWVAGDYIYLLSTDAELLCISAADGGIRWITQLKGWRKISKSNKKQDKLVWSGPVLAGNRLIVVSSDGRALSVSPYTGEVLGKIKLDKGTFVAPIVAQNSVFILTDSAKLLALR